MILTLIRLLESEEIRLHLLHKLAQICGDIARVFGNWSLHSERAYYDVANSLH